MNTNDLEKELIDNRFADVAATAASYLRCQELLEKPPDDVEVIILKQAGLMQLLGPENFDFVLKFCTNEAPECEGVSDSQLNVHISELLTTFRKTEQREQQLALLAVSKANDMSSDKSASTA